MSTGGRSSSGLSERSTGLRFSDAAGAARSVEEGVCLLDFASFCVVSPEKKAFRLFSVTCHFLPNLIPLILPSRRYLWMETRLIPRSSTRSSISYTFIPLITFIRFSPYAWTAAGSRSFRESPVSLVPRFINTVSHRERRCAAPWRRRATETYSQQYGARSAYSAGADAAALECNRICETESLASDLPLLSFAETQRLVNVPAVFMPRLPGGVLPCGPPVFVDQSQAGYLPVFPRPNRPSFHPGPHSQQLFPPAGGVKELPSLDAPVPVNPLPQCLVDIPAEFMILLPGGHSVSIDASRDDGLRGSLLP